MQFSDKTLADETLRFFRNSVKTESSEQISLKSAVPTSAKSAYNSHTAQKKACCSDGTAGFRARSTGLEPAASNVTGWRSNQLSYDPSLCLSATSTCGSVQAIERLFKNTGHNFSSNDSIPYNWRQENPRTGSPIHFLKQHRSIDGKSS